MAFVSYFGKFLHMLVMVSKGILCFKISSSKVMIMVAFDNVIHIAGMFLMYMYHENILPFNIFMICGAIC